MKTLILSGIVLLGFALPLKAASYYPAKLDDPKAVYLTKERFQVRADGVADDSTPLQSAIDKVEAEHRSEEHTSELQSPC